MNKRPPVLLMHDYLSSSEDFVNNGNNSLGFLLALDGFRTYQTWLKRFIERSLRLLYGAELLAEDLI